MSTEIYTLILKLMVALVLTVSSVLIVSAIKSAKEMGGTLGKGLKKIAAGTIAHTILIATYLALEHGGKGYLTDEQIRWFFLGLGLFGSSLLVAGYLQIYRITKRLKLFTM